MINPCHLKAYYHRPTIPLPFINTQPRACHRNLESLKNVTVKDGEILPMSPLAHDVSSLCAFASFSLLPPGMFSLDGFMQPNSTLPSGLCSNSISFIKSSWLDHPSHLSPLWTPVWVPILETNPQPFSGLAFVLFIRDWQTIVPWANLTPLAVFTWLVV